MKTAEELWAELTPQEREQYAGIFDEYYRRDADMKESFRKAKEGLEHICADAERLTELCGELAEYTCLLQQSNDTLAKAVYEQEQAAAETRKRILELAPVDEKIVN